MFEMERIKWFCYAFPVFRYVRKKCIENYLVSMYILLMTYGLVLILPYYFQSNHPLLNVFFEAIGSTPESIETALQSENYSKWLVVSIFAAIPMLIDILLDIPSLLYSEKKGPWFSRFLLVSCILGPQLTINSFLSVGVRISQVLRIQQALVEMQLVLIPFSLLCTMFRHNHKHVANNEEMKRFLEERTVTIIFILICAKFLLIFSSSERSTSPEYVVRVLSSLLSGGSILYLTFMLVYIAFRLMNSSNYVIISHHQLGDFLNVFTIISTIIIMAVILLKYFISRDGGDEFTLSLLTTMLKVLISLTFSLTVIPTRYYMTLARIEQDRLQTRLNLIRYVSHEMRTPLNTALLGLKYLDEQLNTISINYTEANKLGNSIQTDSESLVSPRKVNDIKGDSTQPLPNSGNLKALDLLSKVIDGNHLEEMIETVKLVIDSGDTAIATLNDLLTFDKIDEKKLEIELESINPWVIVSESARPFELNARASHVNLTISCLDIDSGWIAKYAVKADKFKLSQVIRNLISNALKFTPQGGNVNVVLQKKLRSSLSKIEHIGKGKPSKYVLELSVTDTGPGISKENQKKLFGQYVQFNPGQLQQGKGSGLGLWISKSIIELHGGIIRVDSEGVGFGTCFIIEMPLHVKRDTAAAPGHGVGRGLSQSQFATRSSSNVEMSHQSSIDSRASNNRTKSVRDLDGGKSLIRTLSRGLSIQHVVQTSMAKMRVLKTTPSNRNLLGEPASDNHAMRDKMTTLRRAFSKATKYNSPSTFESINSETRDLEYKDDMDNSDSNNDVSVDIEASSSLRKMDESDNESQFRGLATIEETEKIVRINRNSVDMSVVRNGPSQPMDPLLSAEGSNLSVSNPKVISLYVNATDPSSDKASMNNNINIPRNKSSFTSTLRTSLYGSDNNKVSTNSLEALESGVVNTRSSMEQRESYFQRLLAAFNRKKSVTFLNNHVNLWRSSGSGPNSSYYSGGTQRTKSRSDSGTMQLNTHNSHGELPDVSELIGSSTQDSHSSHLRGSINHPRASWTALQVQTEEEGDYQNQIDIEDQINSVRVNDQIIQNFTFTDPIDQPLIDHPELLRQNTMDRNVSYPVVKKKSIARVDTTEQPPEYQKLVKGQPSHRTAQLGSSNGSKSNQSLSGIESISQTVDQTMHEFVNGMRFVASIGDSTGASKVTPKANSFVYEPISTIQKYEEVREFDELSNLGSLDIGEKGSPVNLPQTPSRVSPLNRARHHDSSTVATNSNQNSDNSIFSSVVSEQGGNYYHATRKLLSPLDMQLSTSMSEDDQQKVMVLSKADYIHVKKQSSNIENISQDGSTIPEDTAGRPQSVPLSINQRTLDQMYRMDEAIRLLRSNDYFIDPNEPIPNRLGSQTISSSSASPNKISVSPRVNATRSKSVLEYFIHVEDSTSKTNSQNDDVMPPRSLRPSSTSKIRTSSSMIQIEATVDLVNQKVNNRSFSSRVDQRRHTMTDSVSNEDNVIMVSSYSSESNPSKTLDAKPFTSVGPQPAAQRQPSLLFSNNIVQTSSNSTAGSMRKKKHVIKITSSRDGVTTTSETTYDKLNRNNTSTTQPIYNNVSQASSSPHELSSAATPDRSPKSTAGDDILDTLGVRSPVSESKFFPMEKNPSDGIMCAGLDPLIMLDKCWENGLSILLVDDSSLNRKMTKRLLKSYGHAVEETENGKTFLDIMRPMMKSDATQRGFDIILMDDNMPLMSGPDATEMIRRDGYKGIIYGVTGDTFDDQVNHFIQKGATAVFSKPLNIDQLKKKISEDL